MTETDAITALDADWAIPCEVRTGQPRPAEWIVHLGTCCIASHHTRLFCSTHLQALIDMAGPLECKHCRAVVPTVKDAIRRFEPLNRRTP